MVDKFAPGSFTKNYGWDTSPPGLHKLYENIRRGFVGHSQPVSREQFRTRHGPGPDLVPVNFFLHNTISGPDNLITPDELIRQAVTTDHSQLFDQLALFALHLAKTGKRTGSRNGDEFGAAFANDYVRNCLWADGGWRREAASSDQIKARFNQTVKVTSAKNDAGKSATNYFFMLQQLGITNQVTPIINSRWTEWVGEAAFLLFDRFSVDEFSSELPDEPAMVDSARSVQFYRLIGAASEEQVESTITMLAKAYIQAGGLHRQWVSAAEATLVSAGSKALSVAAQTKWSDETALEAQDVERRRREVLSQLRNPANVRELKAKYDNECLFCGRKVIVGVKPDRFYSEAAHVRPLGTPHNGPDLKDNMMLLCPEHHLQFDRGVLRVQTSSGKLILVSQVPGDPLDGKVIELKPQHTLDRAHLDWHFAFWERP